MKGRTTPVAPVVSKRPRITALHVLLGMVIFELCLVALGLLLVDLGWKPAREVPPAPMVSNVQLPDVPGDGS